MASTTAAAPSLPHRTVTSIRATGGGSSSSHHHQPPSPHTPTRPTGVPSIAFGSPSSLRAEDDLLVVELGSRRVRVGFAGDPVPKKVASSFAGDQQRRAGDFRAWMPDFRDDWRSREAGRPWGFHHELWQLDVRGQDLALVGDKLERELRDAFTRYVCWEQFPM